MNLLPVHTKHSIFPLPGLDPSPMGHAVNPGCCSIPSLTTPLVTGGVCLLTGPQGLSHIYNVTRKNNVTVAVV